MAEFGIDCEMCGEHFVAKAAHARYCPKCKRKINCETSKKLNKTWREPTKAMEPAKEPAYKGFVPAKCPDDCLYWQKISGDMPMCGYFLITGELRGCEPGPGCKRYVQLKNRTRHRGITWDVARGYEMWLKGSSDAEIAKAIHTKPENVKAYRLRVWEKENEKP